MENKGKIIVRFPNSTKHIEVAGGSVAEVEAPLIFGLDSDGKMCQSCNPSAYAYGYCAKHSTSGVAYLDKEKISIK